MSYKKTKIAVLSSKEGYNKAATIYNTFHKGLASYDKGLYQRFLPRDLSGKVILDVGSGDSRLFSYFADKGINHYIGFDIAEKLLKRSPSRVEKVIGDIEESRPFEDESVDIILCFFVFVHLSDLQHFFSEAKRVMKSGGDIIILHNFQRRSYIYELPGDTFKIQDFHRKPIDVEKRAFNAGFHTDSIALEEDATTIGTLYHMKA